MQAGTAGGAGGVAGRGGEEGGAGGVAGRGGEGGDGGGEGGIAGEGGGAAGRGTEGGGGGGDTATSEVHVPRHHTVLKHIGWVAGHMHVSAPGGGGAGGVGAGEMVDAVKCAVHSPLQRRSTTDHRPSSAGSSRGRRRRTKRIRRTAEIGGDAFDRESSRSAETLRAHPSFPMITGASNRCP
eukprot:1436745-Prymnesium_polylepis.1